MNGWIYYPNMIGDIKVDVIPTTSHILSAEVSQNPIETGPKVSEHIVLQPRTLSIAFEQTNTSGGAERARNVWGQFKTLYENRTLISIITEHETYENMAISNLTGLEAAPFKGKLQCTITLTQINFVNLQFIPVPEAWLTGGQAEMDLMTTVFPNLDFALNTQKTASSPINGGSQSGSDVKDWQSVIFSGTILGRQSILTPIPPQEEAIYRNRAMLEAAGVH